MKRKEEAMKKYIASFLAICMIFVMVPILPAEAAGLEDTERVEIFELVESYMDSRETAVMTGDTESLRTVAVNGIRIPKLCPFCSNSRLGSKYAHFFQQ